MGHISNAVLSKDFILGIKVQPNKAHSTTLLIKGQSQNFPKLGIKLNNWPYVGGYLTFRLNTWYQGTSR